MTEDLFAADNSDAYDIVRNSDFMVSWNTLSVILRTAEYVVHFVIN